MVRAALDYARKGWRVLPLHGINEGGFCTCNQGASCGSPGKHPLVGDWRNVATTDEKAIAAWFDRWPRANLGLVTGEVFDVIDIDSDEGVEQLKLALSSDQLRALSATPHVRTGRESSGWHYYVSPTGLRQGAKLLPGVDLRSAGGYVVAPPSRHVSGQIYRFTSAGSSAALVAAPEPLLVALDRSARTKEPPAPPTASDLALGATSSSGRKTWGTGDKRYINDPVRYTAAAVRAELEKLVAAPAGSGNDNLNGVAFRLFQFVYGGTLGEDECSSMLHEAMRDRGQRLQRPVNEIEVERTIQSAKSAAAYKRDGGLVAASERSAPRHLASVPPPKDRRIGPVDVVLARENKRDRSIFELVTGILADSVTMLLAAGFSKDKAIERVVTAFRRDTPMHHSLIAEASRIAGCTRGIAGEQSLVLYLTDTSHWSPVLPGPHEEAAAAALSALGLLLSSFEPGDAAVKSRLRSLAETCSRPSQLLLSSLPLAGGKTGSTALEGGTANLEGVQNDGSATSAADGQLSGDEALLATLVIAAGASRGYPGDLDFLNRQVSAESRSSHDAFVAACRKVSGGSTLAETLADKGPLDAMRLFTAACNDLTGKVLRDPGAITEPPPPEVELSGKRAREVIGHIAAASAPGPLDLVIENPDDLAVAGRLVSAYGLALVVRPCASPPDGEQSLGQSAQGSASSSPPALTLVPDILDAPAPVADPKALLREVSRLPDLAKMTAQQTNDLVEVARGVDEDLAADARDLLIRRLLPVVGHAIAKLDIKSATDREDARQAGMLRTLSCIERFDPQAGMSLSTYVYGSAQKAAVNWLQRERGDLAGSSELGRERSPARSLDAPARRLVDDDDVIGLADVIADDKSDDPVDVATAVPDVDRLRVAIEGLPERERDVVKAHDGFLDGVGKSFDEIGAELGITATGAQHIYDKGLCHLRDAMDKGPGQEDVPANAIPARTLEEMATAAQKRFREKKNKPAANIDTEIESVIAEERSRHGGLVADMESRIPEGLHDRLAKLIADGKKARSRERREARPAIPALLDTSAQQPSPAQAAFF